jgi:hypothetical protein
VSAAISTPEPASWLRLLVSGRPHQQIASDNGIYLYRWFLLPRNRWCNVYLHKFVSSDDPPALHNHPWWFASLLLSGTYCEVTEHDSRWRVPGRLVVRPARYRHRVELAHDDSGREQPCWSVVVTGPRTQAWGFFCPRRTSEWQFVPWRNFSGGGCGETREDDANDDWDRHRKPFIYGEIQ